MTPSDWIALGALVVACLSIIFNFFTNRENIRARRTEIATEKSVEAFREIVEKLLILKQFTYENNFKRANEAQNNSYHAILKYRVYFPQKLYNELITILEKLRTYRTKKIRVEKNPELFGQASYEINRVIERIQEFIGLEIEEKSRKETG